VIKSDLVRDYLDGAVLHCVWILLSWFVYICDCIVEDVVERAVI
jgi:hypothetical protein